VFRNSVQISAIAKKFAKIIFKSATIDRKIELVKKGPKKTLFGLFSNMKKAKGVKKTKNYKFGLKKAKLTTLLAIPVTTAIYMI